MLFAVEGGGFFSSSASGYSSGLSLLLLGHKNEERNMKISPWNHYHLVRQKATRDLNKANEGCSFFSCFGCASSDDVSLHHKSFQHSENLAENSSVKGMATISSSLKENERKIWLKSSLKKSSSNCCAMLREEVGTGDSMEKVKNNISCFTGRRKVQWSDTCGKELAEIREFEISDDGHSEDGLEHRRVNRCECVIQ